MSAAAKLLNRLTRVKTTGPDRGAAACPICQSRNGRPISYRLMPDGRVLLHAFCGCDTQEILRAIGLRFSDLFPVPIGEYKRERTPFNALELLQAVAHEITVVHLIVCDIQANRCDDEHEVRLTVAERRLGEALLLLGETAVPEEIRRIRRAASRVAQ